MLGVFAALKWLPAMDPRVQRDQHTAALLQFLVDVSQRTRSGTSSKWTCPDQNETS